jgi:hypothetical protein
VYVDPVDGGLREVRREGSRLIGVGLPNLILGGETVTDALERLLRRHERDAAETAAKAERCRRALAALEGVTV